MVPRGSFWCEMDFSSSLVLAWASTVSGDCHGIGSRGMTRRPQIREPWLAEVFFSPPQVGLGELRCALKNVNAKPKQARAHATPFMPPAALFHWVEPGFCMTPLGTSFWKEPVRFSTCWKVVARVHSAKLALMFVDAPRISATSDGPLSVDLLVCVPSTLSCNGTDFFLRVGGEKSFCLGTNFNWRIIANSPSSFWQFHGRHV